MKKYKLLPILLASALTLAGCNARQILPDLSSSEPSSSAPTSDPSSSSGSTSSPTSAPTSDPTSAPTSDPTSDPTSEPTTVPTSDPTSSPSSGASSGQTSAPSSDPTSSPSSDPTSSPSSDPTSSPSSGTSYEPTSEPSGPVPPSSSSEPVGPSFPSEQIAEDLASEGVTDVVPVYSGSDVYEFGYYSGLDGRQLYWSTEVGNEPASIATYQADLLAAGYTELGADQYGDMHYASPNAQLELCAWNGEDLDEPGYVMVDIYVTMPLTSIEFEVGNMLFEYLEMTAPVPNYECEGATYEEGASEDQSSYIYYIYDSNYDEMTAFAASLVLNGWKIRTDKWGDYYAAFGNGACLYIGDYTAESLGCVVVQFYAEQPGDAEFPSEEIAASLENVSDVVPAYSGTTFSGYYYSASYHELFWLDDYDAVPEAIAQYAADLLAAGYTEGSTDAYGRTTYVSPNEELDVLVWNGALANYGGYVIVDISYHIPGLEEFPFDEVVDFFAGNELDVEFPEAYETEEGYFEIHDENVESTGIYEVRVFGSSAEEMGAFADAMAEAGWNVGPGGYEGDYLCTFGDTVATCEIQDWIDYSYGCIRVLFYVGDEKVREFPMDDVLNFLEDEGLEFEENPIPAYEVASEDAYFEFDDSWAAWFGSADVYVMNTTHDEAENYAYDLLDAGFNLVAYVPEFSEDEEPVLVSVIYAFKYVTGGVGDLEVVIYDFLETNGYVDLTFGVIAAEFDEFPSEVIADDLAPLGVTLDSVPVFSGEASAYYYDPSYHEVEAVVGEENEDAAVLTYINDLLEAGYVEGEEDDYGDMHYISPNGEIDVCVYSGVPYGAEGSIFIDLIVLVEPPVEEGWSESAQGLMNDYLGELFPYVDADVVFDWDYDADEGELYVWLADDASSALEEALTAGGYEFSVDDGYYEFSNGTVSGYAMYFSSYEATLIVVPAIQQPAE